jgi:hypothetical protein
MNNRCGRAPRWGARTGSTLALSLIVVTTMVILAATFLQFSSSLTRRQGQAADQKRSFYVAEAGLAEAFAGLRVGKSGTVGTQTAPARFGSGLFWVTAEDLTDGQVRLSSTGRSGSAETILDLVVVEGTDSVAALGLFSQGDLEIPSGSLIDSYDSSEGDYVPPPAPEPPPPPSGGGSLGGGVLGGGTLSGGSLEGGSLSLEEGTSYKVFNSGEEREGSITLYEDIGNREMARVSTNGNVTISEDLGDTTRVLGDLRPGPSGTLAQNGEPEITGSISQLSTAVVLPPVNLPTYTLDPGFTQSSSTPVVLPAVQGGFQHLVVKPGCTATITGPTHLLLEQLVIESGGELILDTSVGRIDIYVMQTLELAAGSFVTMTESNPLLSSLQYSGSNDVLLLANGEVFGVVYAPFADISLASSLELFGSIIANSLTLTGPASIHFDEALGIAAERAALPSLLSWRILELEGTASPGGDPFDALGVDKDLLAKPVDAHEDQNLEIDYYDKSGTLRTYNGAESSFDWSDVSQVLKISRDAEVVGEVEGLAGIGGVGGGGGVTGNRNKNAALAQ